MLSICIPTYNRPGPLRRTLRVLVPQLRDGVEIVVVDNNSAYPIAEVMQEFDVYASIKYVRNRVNIGAHANFMRVFEFASGDWIWLLGDDDRPNEDAIDIILDTLSNHADLKFIHFDREPEQRRATLPPIRGFGLKEFLATSVSFDELLFMSVGLYRRNDVISALPWGYSTAGTFANHVALMLILIGKNNGWLLSNSSIVKKMDPESDHQWSTIPLLCGIQSLCDLEIAIPHRKELSAKITKMSTTWISAHHTVVQVLRRFVIGEITQPKAQFDACIRNFFRFSPYSLGAMWWRALSITLIFPNITIFLIKKLGIQTKTPLTTDQYDRI